VVKTTAFAVRHVVNASELLSQAVDQLTRARLETIRVSGGGDDDFRGTDLNNRFSDLVGRLMEESYALEHDVRALAELIPPSQHNQKGGGDRG
jgi:hypothetical protein